MPMTILNMYILYVKFVLQILCGELVLTKSSQLEQFCYLLTCLYEFLSFGKSAGNQWQVACNTSTLGMTCMTRQPGMVNQMW